MVVVGIAVIGTLLVGTCTWHLVKRVKGRV